MELTGQQRSRLYIISPPDMDLTIFVPRLEQVLEAGDVAAFQLRLPKASDEKILRKAERLMPITQAYGVAFIINDRADLAKKAGADGVHLGLQDIGVREARALLGEDAIIGASAIDSKHLAMTAAERGASYVSFGPFFKSRSPFYPPEVLDAQNLVPSGILSWWQDTMEIPCVAAGGIKPANCAELVKAGADFICASTAIWEHPQGAAAAVKAFNEAIMQAAG